MKILIDINHPAHVHYFRNLIRIMKDKGHSFRVINRNSKMINYLLDCYGIEHVIRNHRPKNKGTLASLRNLLVMVRHCIRESRRFHPDLYLGFGSSACAIASFFFRKPCLLLDDTEHNALNHKLYKPFVKKVLTPFYFQKTLWKKKSRQESFNAYVEQLYLHSKYFSVDDSVLERLGLRKGEYVFVRYIAYDAHHDIKARPLDLSSKKKIISELSKKYKIVLSLENEDDRRDVDFAPYLLDFPPEDVHSIMAGAAMVLTEGATMASEAFVLGVPYVYLNPLRVGNVDCQCSNYPDQAHQTTDADAVLGYADEISALDYSAAKRRSEIESMTLDPTDYLIEEVLKFCGKTVNR